MSTETTRIVSRVARLAGLVSKPELNGKFVLVGSWNADTQRYSATTFAEPNNEASALTVAVKRANLELISTSFEDVYPSAEVADVLHPCHAPIGAILDLSKRPLAAARGDPIVFDKSCFVRGETLTSGGDGRPTTQIITPIIVQLDNESDVIEFENIDFNTPTRGGGVSCLSGKNIIFRRCKFFSLDTGCGVGEAVTEVVFENCWFEDLAGSGVVVDRGGRATLLNCRICRTNMGIEVRNGASAHCIHTIISDTKQPCVAVYAKGLSLTMEMCTLLRSKDSGVMVVDGGKICLEGCRMEGCAMAGVAIEGPSRSAANICSSVFTSCQHGVLEQTGKSDVTIERSKIIQNQVHGLWVAADAVGEVVVRESLISGNGMRDINNDGGPRSTLIRDGRTLAQDGIMANLSRSNPAAAKRVLEIARRHVESTFGDNMIGNNSALDNARVRKMAGVGSVFCAACNKEEPPKVKFNKCGRCLNKCYCSKECQATHWKVHKIDCKSRVKNPQLQDTTKSVNKI